MTENDRDNLQRLVEQLTSVGDFALDALEQERYVDLTRIAIQGEVYLPQDLTLLRGLAWFCRGLILHRKALHQLDKAPKKS